MKKILSILVALPLLAGALSAQSIKVQTRDLVTADEMFNVVFTVEGDKPSSFEWNPGENFQLIWGPQQGSSTSRSVSIVNGKVQSSSVTSHTYTYTLQPTAAGQFRLPEAEAVIGGNTVRSRSVTVTVVSGGDADAGAQRAAPQQGGQESTAGEQPASDISLVLQLSKTKAVVGENLSANLVLRQRADIAGFEDVKFPVFHGFWSQETYAPNNIEWHRENIGGKIYNVATLRSYKLVPQRTGDITVEPAELVCVVNVRTARRRTGNPFDDFFGDDYTRVRRKVSTRPVTIHVSPLPGGAPASFCGGVGKFSISASLSKDSLSTHDAAALVVKVRGEGNLSLTETPKVNFPPDFETYDVKVTEGKGEKTFEYPFIPRSKGDFTLGPVEYSYYDIEAGRYVTVRSRELPLKVSRSAVAPGAAPQGESALVISDQRKDVRDIGSDIRFISTEAQHFRPKGAFFVSSPAFRWLCILLPLLALLIWVLWRRSERRRSDVAGSRNRAATKQARKRLSRAEGFLKQEISSAFYEELYKALLGFVSDKLLLDASEMSKENIAAKLGESGVAQEAVGELLELLDACEFARYAPSEGGDAMKRHYEAALSVIAKIDQSMKKKRSGSVAALLLPLLLLGGFHAQAASPADSLWRAGVEAYGAGQWEEARSAWLEIDAQGVESPDLYTNLGDACYKLGDLAGAVLWYERSLKLKPSDRTARYNLEFVRRSLQDKIDEVPEFFLKEWLRRIGYWMPSDAWAGLFLGLLVLFLAALLLFALSAQPAWRKTGFFSAIVLLLLALGCLTASLSQKHHYFRADRAVVTAPVVSVSSSPGGNASKDLFVLHEGTCVTLLEEIGGWCNIELSDGRQGWMAATNLEKI
jgi:tetratricopeptide (TPR) repeat protein